KPPSRRGPRSRSRSPKRPRSSRGGCAGSGCDAAASRFGAAPPRADRGAATIRAGSAPMPRTPRLPGVMISKSRSSRPAPNASRAFFSASSTDLPVNSRYALMSASSPSAALSAPLSWTDGRGRGGGAIGGRVAARRAGSATRRGARSTRLRRSAGDGRWNRNWESRRVVLREFGRPTKNREQGAPTHDQVLLNDREDGGHDPVQEQARRQEATVCDGDEREDHHRLALDIRLRVVLCRRWHHHPALDELQQPGDDGQQAEAADHRQREQDLRSAPVDPEDIGLDARLGRVDDAVDDVRAGKRDDLAE